MNLFKEIKGDDTQEVITVLFESPSVRIERIVSSGQTSPDEFWYDQPEDEFVTVLQGNAILDFRDRLVVLQEGDTCLIEAHQKHRVAYTSSVPYCVWLCVFSQRKEENEE